jgi:hypothetical protein
MERVISEAERRGAKVVLVGDPEQLQAVEAGAAFRSIAERHGWAEITDIRRQREEWQRAATRQLATGRTDQALAAYAQHGNTHVSETRDQARAGLIEAWDRDRDADPTASRIILTHTNDQVQALNGLARDRLRQAGELGEDVAIETTRGSRCFAAGDRIMFLRNERSLGVKNGSLGRVEGATTARMAVLLDDGRHVAFDVKDYRDLDHGYAATIHKAQGVTVDRVHVLATPGLDRHATYVALSRHRDRVNLHYGRDDFTDRGSLVRTLWRERGKDMASDYQPQVERSRQPAQSPSQRLAAAVQRAAIALRDVMTVREGGRAESPAQARELEQAGKALNEIRPNASRDLRAAFMRDMRLLDEVVEGRTGAAIKSMEWERRFRGDPQLRADHFVKTWRALTDQHSAFENKGDEKSANRVRAQMSVIARGLERDAQVESLLRGRERELGIPPYQERPLSQMLPNWIGWGRGRGLER